MRYRDFSGLTPKLKPQMHTGVFAQEAHNLDLYGGVLRPLRTPGMERECVGVDGTPMAAAPETIYDAGGVWVGCAWVGDAWA